MTDINLVASGEPKRILVTGGRGFIGTHLVRQLRNTAAAVLSIDLVDARDGSAPGGTEVVADIRDKKRLAEIITDFKPHSVLDLASYTEVSLPASEYKRNVDATDAVTSVLSGRDDIKYIFYSTQFVHRRAGKPPQSDDDYNPTEAYGESKVQSEQIIRSRLPPDQWLILRPTYIWGAGLTRFRDGLLRRLAKGQFLVPNDPGLKRYYGYVESVAQQTIEFDRLTFKDLSNKVYYISDDSIALTDFCANLVEALGSGRARAVPPNLIRALGRAGSMAKRLGLPAPITEVQARELTTDFPIPLDRTLRAVGSTVNYPSAAKATVAWALNDPSFAKLVRG